MRQWMVNPKIMCKDHLLGEHLEMHMYLGSFKRKKTIDGFIENNLAEPESLRMRHDQLVDEMINRGYNHKSPMFEEELQQSLEYLGDKRYAKVDSEASLKELLKRCPKCFERYKNEIKKKNKALS